MCCFTPAPNGLGWWLASSTNARKQYAKTWVSYAYERAPVDMDLCTIDELSRKMADAGYSVLDLVVDLTQADTFRYRVRE